MGSPWHLLALLLATSLAPTLHHPACAVAVPPVFERVLTPLAGGVTAWADDAPNTTEDSGALEHRSVDGALVWDVLGMGEARSTATPSRPDLGQSSLRDARGAAALGNVSAETPRESGEEVAVTEDDARNWTGARLTARPTLDGPHYSTLHDDESSSASSETIPATTSPSPEENAFSSVRMLGDSSLDQVRNLDAPTRAVTSLDDSMLEKGVSRTTTFPDEARVLAISLALNTTGGVVPQNLPMSWESEHASTAPSPNLKEATTLTEQNGSRDTSPMDLPETSTDLSILPGKNTFIIEAQLTSPAKTHTSPQNSTELVLQTTEGWLKTPNNYLERDRTLYQATEAAETFRGDLQQKHLELPTASCTPLGIKDPRGLLVLLTTQASTTMASSIVHNTKEPVVSLDPLTTTSPLGSVFIDLAQRIHPPGPNISDMFLGNAGAAKVRPLEAALPGMLEVSMENSGNRSQRLPADASTQELYRVSEPQVLPATASLGEVATVRHATDQGEETSADASVPVVTSVDVEASALPNSTFAVTKKGLWVLLGPTQTAMEPAVNRTGKWQLPAVMTPAESFLEVSEVPSPKKSTTSLESAAVIKKVPTTIPARDLGAVETSSLREEPAAETDFPVTTEDAAPRNRSDAVGLVTHLPVAALPCVPLEPPRGLTHEFRLVFHTASEFSWEQVEMLERRIQDFLRDGPCPRRFARTAFILGPPHVLSWTDPSANASWCDRFSVEALLRTMRSKSGHPTPAVVRAFYPEFLVSSVELQLRGACVSEIGAFPTLTVVVGVALSAALLAGLLAVLCRFLRPRSRRLDLTPAGDSFDLKQRQPTLLPGEAGRVSADGTPRKAPRAPFVVDTDFCYINPNFLEVARPSPPAPPYRPEPHGPHSVPGGPDDLASSSSGVESDPSAGEAADAS